MTAIDLGNNIKSSVVLAPASRTAAANGTGVDTKDETWGVFVISQGAMHATETITYKIQDSADNSAWADVNGLDGAAASFTGAANADDTIYLMRVECNRLRRYLRVVATPSGSNAQVFGVTWVSIPAYTGDAATPNVEA